jgi:monoamine oxidase
LLQTSNIVGYATGRNAERLSQLSRDQIIEGFLQQLDSMFGSKSAQKLLSQDATPTPPATEKDKEDNINWKTPATSSYLDCFVADWSKAPYIKGCHSVPTTGATARAREELGRPVNERVFFAGEATSPTAFMTVQGAMETGEAAAIAVMDSLPRSRFIVKPKL